MTPHRLTFPLAALLAALPLGAAWEASAQSQDNAAADTMEAAGEAMDQAAEAGTEAAGDAAEQAAGTLEELLAAQAPEPEPAHDYESGPDAEGFTSMTQRVSHAIGVNIGSGLFGEFEQMGQELDVEGILAYLSTRLIVESDNVNLNLPAPASLTFPLAS